MAHDQFQELLDQASQGDRQAIDQLLQENMAMLLAYIRLKVHPMILEHESCEDLLQTVCREALEHQEGFEYRGQPAFRAWLFTTAVNKIKDRLRYYTAQKRDVARETHVSNWSRSSRIRPRDKSTFSPSQVASRREDLERLEQVIQQLPPDYQEIIILSRFLELSYAEIAEQMDRSVPAVRTLLHRALGRLGLLMHKAEKESEEGA